MASHDFFMRQIEGITDILSFMIFDKTSSDGENEIYDTQLSCDGHSLLIDLRCLINLGLLNDAENLLFERMESDKETSCLEVARQFYLWLDMLSNDELKSGNFSRDEIIEGRKSVQQFYAECNGDK